MREKVLEYLRCPICQSTKLRLLAFERDDREIREGHLQCLGCDHLHEVHKGIIDLLPNPTPVIQSEQGGWLELLGETSEELVATMLKLPYLDDAIWVTTYENYDQVVSQVDFSGKCVLDIGAGRCWSTRWIKKMGASDVIGIDILRERFIGLETADVFLQHEDVYFERVLGDMNNLPLRPAAFDIVFMTGTLHHSSNLVQTLRQVAMALVPGGIAVVINEPVRSLLRSKDLTGCSEVDHEINEHVYRIFEYLWAAWRAGLRPRLLFPRSISKYLDKDERRLTQEMGAIAYRIVSRTWSQAMFGPLIPAIYLIASMPLVMIAGKPAS